MLFIHLADRFLFSVSRGRKKVEKEMEKVEITFSH